jgi:hypothetical protein
MGKTIVVDDNIHQIIIDYQEMIKKQTDYELQIKEIVAKAVKEFIINEKKFSLEEIKGNDKKHMELIDKSEVR